MLASSIPSQIGKYRVLDRIGRGAFGVVYRCVDSDLERTVALKMLVAAEHASSELLERFSRESKAAARLSHPNIVQVFETGVEQSQPFLVMEFVEGKTLDQWMKGEPWDTHATLQILYHLADALAYSHDSGVIHRDIKPSNIIVDKRGRPKLTDFGLARLADDARWLSTTGDLLGTPRYMSPEQALMPSDEIDPRTDIYSLGAIGYELLTGKPLVDGPTQLAILKDLTDGNPVPVEARVPNLPREVADLIERMCQKERDARYATAHEVRDDIQSFFLKQSIASPEVPLLASLARNETAKRVVSETLSSKDLTRGKFQAAVAIASIATVFAGCLGAWMYLNRPIDPSAEITQSISIEDGFLDDVQRRSQMLSSLRDDGQYHELWHDLRDDLAAAIRRNPEIPVLRAMRASILARNGETQSALEDWKQVENSPNFDEIHPWIPAARILREKLNTLAIWEVLIMQHLSDGALQPSRYPILEEWMNQASELDGDDVEGQRAKAVASMVRMLVEQSDFSESEVASWPSFSKQDPVYSDLQCWRSLLLMKRAASTHYELLGEEEAAKEDLRKKREAWDQRAMTAIREGLECDSHHLGLLFLRAYRWSLRIEWDAEETGGWAEADRRYQSSFETSYHRYRTAPSRISIETTMGRAALLSSVGKTSRAIDQLNEVIDRNVVPVSLNCYWVWLHLLDPPDGELSIAYLTNLLKKTENATEERPKFFGVYFVRALSYAAMNRWTDARRELTLGKSVCEIGDWSEVSSDFQDWLQSSEQSTLVFRDRMMDAIARIPALSETKQKVQRDLLRDIQKGPVDLEVEQCRAIVANGHLRLARMAAEQDNRAEVLENIRKCLEQNVAPFTIEFVQNEELLSAWNGDGEFQEMYSRFSAQANNASANDLPSSSDDTKP